MARTCTECGNEDKYNFALNIGLCDSCIGEKLEQVDELKTQLEELKGEVGLAWAYYENDEYCNMVDTFKRIMEVPALKRE